jgi:uncharacterized protein (DUF736 family)
MAFEKRDLSGALFKNDKRGNDKAPDYSGDCMVDGREYRLAAWIKESKGGSKFMSLAFTAKEEGKTVQRDNPAQIKGNANVTMDDEIPF